MGSYTLSREADHDVIEIARNSIKQWGLIQAERYVLALHEAFERLAEFPDICRMIDHIRPGYFRMESGRHAVFYRKIGGGVLIMRVLHDRMDVRRHLQPDIEEPP